jgi:thioredoxin 1
MSWLKGVFKGKEKRIPVALNEQNFRREVKQFRGAVLVDVWGPNCAPCTKLAPIMEDLAGRYHGKVKVCELNASSAPRAAGSMGVRGTPTTVAFKNGAEIGRIVGWKPLSFWTQMIESEFAEYVSGEVTPQEAEKSVGPEGASSARKLNTKAAKKAAKKARKKK